jgi:perosamine synthetase
MKRVAELEKLYISEVLENSFRASRGSAFNNRLEKLFSETFGVLYSIGHVNGTATMHTALLALGVGPGDEVIVPPLTMSSTAMVVLQAGAIPIFADVDPFTFTIDPDAVSSCLTERTKALITVALYGLPPDYDRLCNICDDAGIAMIEDNAECFLGQYKGKLVGQFGDFASYSFQSSKHMTCGNGGILTVHDEALADRARKIANLGYATVGATVHNISKNDVQDPNFNRHVCLGFNYRLSELNAAVALAQLERLPQLVGARVKAARILEQVVNGCTFLRPQAEPDGYVNSFWSYSVLLDTDEPETDWYKFRDLFVKNGGHGFYAAWKLGYMEPLFQNVFQHQPGFWQTYEPGLCPVAEHLQQRMIQFKTNYWDYRRAELQSEILARTITEFGG